MRINNVSVHVYVYAYKPVNIVNVNNMFPRDVIYIYSFCVNVFKVNKHELYNDFDFSYFHCF
jgi:hypothetical protein